MIWVTYLFFKSSKALITFLFTHVYIYTHRERRGEEQDRNIILFVLITHTKVGKRRLTVDCMEKGTQVMIITVTLLTRKNVPMHSALRYNITSAEIASLHSLHILVVYLSTEFFINLLLPTLLWSKWYENVHFTSKGQFATLPIGKCSDSQN